MFSISSEVIDDIDHISLIVLESSISVYDALLNEYDKAMVVLENSEVDVDTGFGLFQEESVLDHAMGKHTGDSTFMKIILFIPRLFQGIIQAIGSIFSKDFKKKKETSIDRASQTISNATPGELTSIANEVNQKHGDKISFDPNKKTFTLGRGFRHIKNSIAILFTGPKVLKNIIMQCKSGNTDYKLLAKDIWKILKREKSADEVTTALTLNTLSSLLDDSFAASTAVSALSSEVSMYLEKKMKADFANGKNIDKQADAKQLMDGISAFSKHVSKVTFFGKVGKGIIDFFGQDVSRFAGSVLSKVPGVGKTKAVKNMVDKGHTGSQNLVGALTSKGKVNKETSEEQQELFDAKQENKGLKAELSGELKNQEIEDEVQDEKDRLNKQIKEEGKDKKRLEKEIDKTTQGNGRGFFKRFRRNK